MRDAVIQVRDAAFSYGGPMIFEHADLDIYPGQVCCLMGVNGCGKTTLIDCILGVYTCSSGEILVGGSPVSELRAAQLARKVAYVPQVHDRSFPYLVRDIVLMGRTAYQKGLGSPGAEDRHKCEEAMERCGIAHLADRPYTQVSGGEMQMVLLTRALVQETPVIVMDEPTAHLDFKNEQLFLETVADLVRNRSLGVLIATHSPNQAFYFENAGVDTQVALMAPAQDEEDDTSSSVCTILPPGAPAEVLNEETLARVYGMDVRVADIDLGGDGHARQIVPIKVRR